MPSTRQDRTEQCFAFVQQFSQERGLAPTLAQVAEHLGLKTPRGAENHLKRLVGEGRLEHFPRQAHAYRLPATSPGALTTVPIQESGSSSDVPVVGRIPAGLPFIPDEVILGHVSWPRDLVAGSFGLKVSGDSMKDAHIIEDDIVVCEPSVEFQDRTVVVALMKGRATIKTYRGNAARWWLEPANDDHEPIFPDEEEDGPIANVVGVLRVKLGKKPKSGSW